MAFNLGGLAKSSGVAKVQRRLKPWDIYDVEFEGARIDEVQGSKDKTITYRILKVRFKNDEGYYEESIFFPKETDDKRPTRKVKDKNGNEVELESASSLERTECFLAHVSAVLNPEQFEKFKEYAAAGKFKDFDMVARYFIEKICKPVIGKQTKLKLIGKLDKDGNWQPCLPYFTRVNRSGDVELSDNFVGDKLFFSEYEEGKRKDYLNAKPTNMKKKANDDLDLDGVGSSDSDTTVDDTPMPADTKSELDSMLDELD